MTRVMRDSTTPTDIPVRGTDIVAGYVNGSFKWSKEGYDRFPGIPHVHIDVNGTDPGEAGILDVEPGDAGISTAVAWVKQRKAAFPHRYPPIIYCDRSHLTPLFNAMNAAGLHIVKDFRLWIATLDGTQAVQDMLGVTAVQYKRARKQKDDGTFAEPPSESVTEGHFDESLVYDDDWRRAEHHE
jgi:hypothetical protein